MATRRSDTLFGAGGADTISGRRGDDVIHGFDPAADPAEVTAIRAARVGGGLDGAVFAGSAPGRPDALFVVQKDVGRIVVLDPATGASSPFLQIPAGELTTGGEQGLLGLAFHPGYAANGRFFVHLVNAAGDIELREYARSAGDPDRADAAPVRTLLTVPHPVHGNHNGGGLAFGPGDDHLYVALGDGGGANDPAGNAQDTDSLLGSILRLDVDGDAFPADPARNYAIPADNPFVGAAGADEIWAYGLRNPWRISFDLNGDLYIADVGQDAREEVNFQPAGAPGGANYGWDRAEGTLGRPPPGATPPIFEYGRDLGGSITGGHVYRGDEPSLQGAYFFADFVSGAIWTLEVAGGVATEVTLRTAQFVSPDAPLRQISSFGLDGTGDLHIVSLTGDIFRLDPITGGDLGDTLEGGKGKDRLFGGPGDDHLDGGKHDDLLDGGTGDDVLRGAGGRDRLVGAAGADRLLGGKSRDRLDGGEGDDLLAGGRGADRFVFGPGDGDDVVRDFGRGRDRLDLTGFDLPDLAAVAALATDTAAGTRIDLTGHGGGTVLLEDVAASGLGASDVLI
jgi:glucose/arabinose dehydrogenase